MEKISAYILTQDSEKYLKEILSTIVEVAEDVLVLDSGSTDSTQAIVESFPMVRFEYNKFRNFKDQRTVAVDKCLYDMVLFLDSDEIPSSDFKETFLRMKKEGFQHEAYTISRNWNVLGKDIHAVYPVTSPDTPIRMYRKSKVSFANSNLVHETPEGYKSVGHIESTIQHITFHTKDELFQKLEFYTAIAAQDLLKNKKMVNTFKLVFSPFAAFYKWYFTKGAYKDGKVGFITGAYAYKYTLRKYQKAIKLKKS